MMRKYLLPFSLVCIISIAASEPASAFERHGFCTFGNGAFRPEFKTAYFKHEGPQSEWVTKRNGYMAEFKAIVLKNYSLDSIYEKVKVTCNWYPIDRVTPSKVEELRNGTLKYGNSWDTDWVPGNTTISGKFIPRK